MEIKIYYEDTDAGGVVYYANYLKYFERARTEFMASKGIDVAKLAERGIHFVVVSAEIYYKKPARLGETITVMTKIVEMGKVSFTFGYKAINKKSSVLIVEGKTKLVCVNNELKPARIPAGIFEKIASAPEN